MAFIDKGEFKAKKMLNDCRALHCDKHQFCVKLTMSISIVFETSLLNIVVLTRKNTKNGTFGTAHLHI